MYTPASTCIHCGHRFLPNISHTLIGNHITCLFPPRAYHLRILRHMVHMEAPTVHPLSFLYGRVITDYDRKRTHEHQTVR